jgi:predicted regulator of Ras-like GTPase activity (Roadblock/LC7/MglB family)
MFEALLKNLVDTTPGGMAAIVMDLSGIALESYSKEGAAVDVSVIGAEFSVVVGSVRRAAEMLESGEPSEMSIQTEKLGLVLRPLSGNYFLALATDPDVNLGKAKYLARIVGPQIAAQL